MCIYTSNILNIIMTILLPPPYYILQNNNIYILPPPYNIMTSQYISKREFLVISADLKERLRVEPIEYMSYDIFLSRLALKFNTTINVIKKCLEPYILNKDVSFKEIQKTNCIRSELAIAEQFRLEEKKRLEEERARKEMEEELANSPKTKEETQEFLKGLGEPI